MTLEQIQKQLLEKFDFQRALNILKKLDENYSKQDLENIAKDLLKLLYQSREMENVYFSSGYLEASRSYIDGIEVNYTLNFSIDISSELSYSLEKSFYSQEQKDKELIKEEIESLLLLNQNEYDLDEDNELAYANILRLEKILLRLDN